MPYHVYILQSLSDGSYYIGYSKDLNKRFLQHNRAKTGYSAKKIPWELVYSEAFNLKSAAIIRERFLKNQKSRDFIRKLIAHEI
jgi:putative endonuclease